MYSDQVFLLLSAAAVLLEMAAVCWVWERKMKQAAQREQEADRGCNGGRREGAEPCFPAPVPHVH